MEKVLLAINGVTPNRKMFSYAVQLCQRLKAELCVLQVIEARRYGEYLSKIRQKARRARRFLEDSMTAVTFAEAGDHETAKDMMIQARKNMNALLPESEKAGVPCRLTMTSGQAEKEIVRYVRQHRDVVLTVYDGAESPETGLHGSSSKKRDVLAVIKRHLPTPMVTMQG
ncbi:MAG: universal stress protein [Deltaproteobacteria bacterium]|nr:universal stress protein [Deltaproteobacteria bacterium]